MSQESIDGKEWGIKRYSLFSTNGKVEIAEHTRGTWVEYLEAAAKMEELQRQLLPEWVTDRRPTIADGSFVFNERGHVVHYLCALGPWKPIPHCEPYVKPKRYKVVQFDNTQWGVLRTADDEGQTAYKYVAHSIPWNNREAADEIAAIYERIAP